MTASQQPEQSMIALSSKPNDMPSPPSRKQRLRWLAASGLLLIGLFVYLLSYWQSPQTVATKPAISRLPVTVVSVSPSIRPLSIQATGITASRWQVDITATIDGQVVNLPEAIDVGAKVSGQSLLAQLNPVSYQAEVAQAESRLAQARVQLARIKHERSVSLKLSNGQLKTPFARYEIQLAAAEADVKAAETSLSLAEQRLADTRIEAPFDAVILQNHLAPGQWVNSGQILFQVASSNSLDISVALSDSQWQLITELAEGWQAEITSHSGQTWPATVRYFSPSRDRDTRQRRMVLSVEAPFDRPQPLLPDQQVEVVFTGMPTRGFSTVPASALTRDQTLWLVDTDDRLARESVEFITQEKDSALVRFASPSETPRRIVRYPLRSMLEGQTVSVQSE
ncbi:efflux RND transporter periplasmic adaptor subunit [Maricurvus nonylphenolicus]|uniref:efflux RND transporter periplasmic adaptor subunit n=1 Tax=Maricurvus nonylphenolicus TaxID=1008307 RepID=UPI0036F3E76D